MIGLMCPMNESREYDQWITWIYYLWLLLLFKVSFRLQLKECNGCHNLVQKGVNFNDFAIVFVKGNAYRIHFWCMSKDRAINRISNTNLSKVDHCKNIKKLVFFSSMYKRWIISTRIRKEIKKDCKKKLEIVTIKKVVKKNPKNIMKITKKALIL